MNVFGTTQPKIIQLDLDEDQFHLYAKISKNYNHTFLFESLAGPEILAETSVMGFDPKKVIQVYLDRIEINQDTVTQIVETDDPFTELRSHLRDSNDQEYRYLGGAVGSICYDAVRLTEDIPNRHNYDKPLMEFGIYDDGIIYDNIRKSLFYFYYDINRFDSIKMNDGTLGSFRADNITSDLDQTEFCAMVDQAKRYINDGDIFQVVLSRRFNFTTSGDTLKLYSTLRRLNPSPYMYHLKQDTRVTVGASPEMLIRITGARVETFPIAGTRKITKDNIENQRLRQDLLRDEKELAEHTMLVDLGRNDIGRVCKYGTVHPESFMDVKRFSHVQHIVSHIVGQLARDKDMFAAFNAVFPAGTVSGAPKVRAMEIIDEMEPVARGKYAGAVGYLANNRCCDFAIAIRSIFIDGTSGFVQSGAGIVSDSIPEREFQETQDKARAMLVALEEASF